MSSAGAPTPDNAAGVDDGRDLDRHASHVFVVGLPRTGTHLMRDILRASGRIDFGPESRFMGGMPRFGVYSRPGLHSQFRGNRSSLSVAQARRLLTETLSPNNRGVGRNAFWQHLAHKQDPHDFTEKFLRSSRGARELFDLALTAHAGDRIPGDKTPANLWYLDVLFEWFPKARVVHMVRDPRASYASMLRKGWVGPQRLGLPDVKPLRVGVGSVTAFDAARAWRRAIALDTRYRDSHPDRYLRCRFEDLVVEPQPLVKRISTFVGVPYQTEMIERSVITSSYMPRGKPGFRAEAVDAWRQDLDPSLSRLLSRLAGPALVSLGYPLR